MIGVLVYGTIKTIISFMGAEQSWTRIIIGLLLLVFIVVQRIIVVRSEQSTIGGRVLVRQNGPVDSRPLLELTGATVRFGADAALDGVDFRLFPARCTRSWARTAPASRR